MKGQGRRKQEEEAALQGSQGRPEDGRASEEEVTDWAALCSRSGPSSGSISREESREKGLGVSTITSKYTARHG